MKKNNGITLIALVITIIVLLILAAVSITGLTDKDKGIVIKAKQAVKETDEAIEKEDEDIKEVIEYANSENIEEPENNGGESVTKPEDENEGNVTVPEEVPTNKIPSGGVYYVGVTSTQTGKYDGASAIYEAGDSFPTIKNGDVYVFGDYEYKYNYYNWQNTWTSSTINGWGVDVLDTSKTSYGEILPTINGKNITDLRSTFLNCSKMTYPPEIPSTVTCILGTYWCCHGLTDLSDFVIPYGVTNMKHAFSTCSNLKIAPQIPNTMVSMYGAFRDCTSLTTVGTIPSSVSVLYATFSNCESLTGTIVINADTIDHTAYIGACFSGTTKPITIKGTCSVLDAIAETSSNANITVK